MPSKKDVRDKIIAALVEKTKEARPCAVCGQNSWWLADRFVVMPVGTDPEQTVLGGTSMPLVPLVCTVCGNTHLLNLRILGFTDTAQLKTDDDDATTKSS